MEPGPRDETPGAFKTLLGLDQPSPGNQWLGPSSDSHLGTGQPVYIPRGNEMADALAQRGAAAVADPIRSQIKALHI
eukprot:778259-Pyramimonas_sp.AAC.1